MDKTNTRQIREILNEFLRENKLDSRFKERNLVESWKN